MEIQKQNKFLVNSAIWYTIGNFMLKGINFITVPLFTRILTTEDYGAYAIYFTWSGFATILIGLGINGTLGSAKANLDEKRYKEYITSNLFLTTICFAIIFIISMAFKQYISLMLDIIPSLVPLLVVQSFFTFVISYISSFYTFEKDHKKYLKVSFIVTLLNIVFSVILIIFMNDNKYLGRIYGSAIATVLVGIICYIRIFKNGKILIDFECWKFCIPIAIPIIFHSLSHIVLNQADRIMLQNYIGDSSVGIYSFTYNIAIIINIINMSINNAWVVWYFEKLKENAYDEIKSNSKKYIMIFTALTCMMILGIPEVIKIISPVEYWGGINLIPFVIVGYFFVFLYTFSVNYEFYIKKTNFIAIGTSVAAIINILVNYLLIPVIGIYGAAIATLIAYIVLFLMHEIIVRVKFSHKEFPFKYYMYAIFVVVGITIIYYIFEENMIVRWGIIIIICISLILNIIKYLKKNKEY